MRILMLCICVVVTGCNFGDKRVKERLKERVGQEAAETQVKEREAREKLVSEMEADLAQRQRIYQALRGEFLGDLNLKSELFHVSAEFVPTVIPFEPNSRVRTPDEVGEDIQRLSLDIKLVIRDASTKALLVNCDARNIRFDLEAGTMSWLTESASCSNVFLLQIVDDKADTALMPSKDHSRELADQILNGRRNSIKRVLIKMRPGSSSEVFEFFLNRVEL